MFPLNSNMPYVKDTGERDRLGNVIGSGGGSELPAYTIADAGKILAVDDTGKLAWVDAPAGSSFGSAQTHIPSYTISSSAKEGS